MDTQRLTGARARGSGMAAWAATLLLVPALVTAQTRTEGESNVDSVLDFLSDPTVCSGDTIPNNPNRVCPTGGGDFTAFWREMELTLTGEWLDGTGGVIDSITPEERDMALVGFAYDEFIASTTAQVELGSTQISNVVTRLATIRGGGAAGRVAARSPRNGGDMPVYSWSGGGGMAAADAAIPNVGLFLNVSGSTGDRDPTALESGFDFDGYGVTAGVDYRVSNSVVMGLALGFGNTDGDFDTSGGDFEVEGGTLSLFFTSTPAEKWYFDGIISITDNDYESNRNVNVFYTDPSMTFTPAGFVAQSDTDGDTTTGGLSLGYVHQTGAWTISPSLQVNYTDVQVDAFNESLTQTSGAVYAGNPDVFGLVIPEQSTDSLTTQLGVDFQRAVSRSWGVFVPFGGASWIHEFNNDQRLVQGYFQGALRLDDTGPNQSACANNNAAGNCQDVTTDVCPVLGCTSAVGVGPSVRQRTDDPDKDYFNVNLGASFQFSRGRALFLRYDGVFGLEDISAHSVVLGGRIGF